LVWKTFNDIKQARDNRRQTKTIENPGRLLTGLDRGFATEVGSGLPFKGFRKKGKPML
jgi:hypothetical protein